MGPGTIFADASMAIVAPYCLHCLGQSSAILAFLTSSFDVQRELVWSWLAIMARDRDVTLEEARAGERSGGALVRSRLRVDRGASEGERCLRHSLLPLVGEDTSALLMTFCNIVYVFATGSWSVRCALEALSLRTVEQMNTPSSQP
ncbi:hypothetical protein THAOC_35541 [Thalassiosira oceanica]|uniref:Uncharacterized protein n=1 Tax=Thalassiosira oceanica TaxID=159749 RepID=K0R1L0_THAOC|nr:hypothetical protein THAOC_35541 [Thalassiosira oceanica]|eukprot:EJK45825.1 hypothetical protein THAOC_35541 [Thalassiosira oceanica]